MLYEVITVVTVIDVWMQHPTRRFLEQPMFESLRRWTRQDTVAEIPLATTIAAMDEARVTLGLTAAWHGPQGVV